MITIPTWVLVVGGLLAAWLLFGGRKAGAGPAPTLPTVFAPREPEPSKLVTEVKRHKAAKAALTSDEATIKELLG